MYEEQTFTEDEVLERWNDKQNKCPATEFAETERKTAGGGAETERAVVQRRRGGVCGRDGEEVYVVCTVCFSLYNQCPGENRSLRRAVVYY